MQARDWKDQKGRVIKAGLVKVEGDKVTIRLDKNGNEFTIPIATLSAADQKYLNEEVSKKAAKEPVGYEDGNVAKAIKPNFDDPWPEKVGIAEFPKIVVVEEDEEKKRFVYHSPHYEFVCDVGLKGSVIKEFAKMFEATFLVMEALPMSFDRARNAKPGKRLRVLLFETRESYTANGGPPGSGGVFLPRNNLILIPLKSLGVKKIGSAFAKDFDSDNQTLAHELVHQLQDLVYDKRGSFGWFTEGIAEYVATSPYTNGRFMFKNNLRTIAKSVMGYDRRTGTGSNLGKEIKVDDLKGFMLQSYGAFTADGRTNYAVAMLLTTYFIHMDDGGSRKNLNAFLKAMRRGEEGEKLLAHLLAGRSWKELGAEISQAWRKYGLKLEFGW